MKQKLPKIKTKSQDILLTSSYNSRLKKRYKLKNDKFLTEENELEDPDNEYQKELEEKKVNIENQRYLIKIYESNYQELYDNLKKEYEESMQGPLETEVKKDDINNIKIPRINLSYSKKDKNGFERFDKTNYVNQSCMKEFFNKYSKYHSLSRKHPLNNYTPSWAFIKSSTEEKIIPNPLGLLRRSGNERDLKITNQKVGDKYMKALSNSLRYSHHLNRLEFSGNRLSPLGTSNLFQSLNINKDLAYRLTTIDLSDNKIGNNNIDELLQFIQDPKCNIEDLNFEGNYIGDENIIKICDSLAIYIKYRLVKLNLGKNNIHDSCINSICQMVNKCSGLRVLNLSHNWLHNPSATKIMKELIEHYELRILDISWNLIGDDLTALPTYEHLVNSEITHPEREFNNYSINEALSTGKLNLRTNPLLPPIDLNKGDKKKDNKKETTTEKPQTVYKEPKKINEKPKEPSPFAIILGEYFGQTQLSLIHLDISHNNLNYSDCKLIAEKSKSNHTILGIHLDGNSMEINCLGFINAQEKLNREKKYYADSHIYYGMNKDYTLRKTNVDLVRKIRGKNNCWICEGFREIQFEYIPEKPIEGDPNDHLVKLHLDFDDYKPFDMIYNGSKYQIIRMCPPGEIHYFFTIDTIPVKSEHSSGNNKFYQIPNQVDYIKYTFESDYMEELSNIQEKLLYQKRKEEEKNLQLSEVKEEEHHDEQNNNNSPDNNIDNIKNEKFDLTQITNKKLSIVVDTMSKIHVKVNRSVINEDYRKTLTFSEPRPERILNKFVKPRTPWSFPISIWAYYGYEYDDVPESYLDKCFEFDFNRCQFNKDFKDEESLNKLKEFLRVRYRDIIDCYKYFASYSGCQTWQITQNMLTEFIYKCPGMCDKSYDINNVYLQQKVVVGNLVDKEDKKNKNKNLGENIVRHQFMNLLVKAAKDKYVTVLKTTKNNFEAVKMGFELHFDEGIKGYSYHKWRKERYYNEKVDNFLKTYLPLFDALFLSWAKQKGPTKKDVWMVLDEFNALVQSFVDINEYPIRDNPYIFNQAINLQINEIYTDKHLNMLLPEFLEAICRAIDKASPIPVFENKDEWPMSRRQELPLIDKLENMLLVLVKLITHPDYKYLREKFPLPSKDLATGLYVPDYESPYYQGYIIKPGVRKKEHYKSNIPVSSKNVAVNDTNEIKNKVQENIISDTNSEKGGEKNNNSNEGANEIKVEENKTEEENKDKNNITEASAQVETSAG